MPKRDSSTVLIVGGGGREHALAWSIARSADVARVLVAPGNGGTAAEAKCRNVDVKETDIDGLLALALRERAGLVVVGPEVPLGLGIVDRFRAAGVPIFGPTQAAARLETSKVWAREFMRRHGIPSPDFTVCEDVAAAEAAVRALGGRCVIKADGLAAGKGVVVCAGVDEALRAAKAMLVDGVFGASGARILVEARASGPELSVMVVTDGRRCVPFVPAQDHKRLLDGDTGPNTGGMGAFAPSPRAGRELLARVAERIILPTIDGMAAEGAPFTGCLFCGLMLTDAGPVVIEYNARFGDPETEVQLMLLESDLHALLVAAAAGDLTGAALAWSPDAAVCVVAASEGYPDTPVTGRVIHGADAWAEGDRLKVFHAGTRRSGEGLVSGGGRVLCVAARRASLAEAARAAYGALGADGIRFDGMHYRRDIGAAAAEGVAP